MDLIQFMCFMFFNAGAMQLIHTICVGYRCFVMQ